MRLWLGCFAEESKGDAIMKLYEIKIMTRPFNTKSCEFLTSVMELKKRFNTLKKDADTLSLRATEVQVNTDLKVNDWVQLLTGDSPGPVCDLTPVDLITSHTFLRKWSKPDES
jgi:hypothetical protein